MDNEIQLISDGDGLAVIGNATDVERFLVSERLPSKDLRVHQLKSVFGTGATVAQASSDIAANSGRWVKLTMESAERVKKYGLMKTKTPGISHAMIGKPGSIKNWLQIEKGVGSFLTNPARLAGVAGLMSQSSMQQTMEEITDYLATIDKKVDDVLRGQKDAALSRMIGMDLVIEETMTIREQVGRVSEVTWSKVQTAPTTIAETQAYALRQIDALAQRLESTPKIGDLSAAVREVEPKVREWLAVLARCFQLQDAVAVLELDRVLDAHPDQLDQHRLGLRAARQNRLDLISRSTERLVARMKAAADAANSKVLLHPTKSPVVVQSSNHVVTGVHDFHARLGIESGRQSSEARRWGEAVAEVKDKALETGAKGVGAARSLGTVSLDRASSVKGRLSSEIAERARRLRREEKEHDGEG
ncbi:hypothetical protein OG585_05995 [Streptomyces sp. NBC_01340]|uniref:hypothetical protein n=1 Tax=unclassified Streptomyces TaxID=2593676 RepID=UPI002258F16D|nr:MULTISPECIES: hypothetical protein [unclassified Streptomyces]MCX4452210.1 hypothetical protein [Streptomyces sp. NBC_01719]MCX4491570.1 hypothetical protein [Streptomyces sp. NBC_01728]WSI36874.1 hypothetical protein OG585_05995 [Streptomyces sp. NBC_01340]